MGSTCQRCGQSVEEIKRPDFWAWVCARCRRITLRLWNERAFRWLLELYDQQYQVTEATGCPPQKTYVLRNGQGRRTAPPKAR